MRNLIIPSIVFLLFTSCGERKVKVTVCNESNNELGTRIIEIPASDVFTKIGADHFYVTDETGKELVSQLTYDSLIIFSANVSPRKSKEYIIHSTEKEHLYDNLTWGKIYPERRDDVAYENQLVGFRIYGPATQAAGEKAFGYDLFLKYPSDSIILPDLYKPETDPAVWAKVDSLRDINPELADEFINSFSYHIDHGKGFDPFAVGPTLGAGVAAIFMNDSIVFPWCYKSAEILDNGPLRFTVALHFEGGENRLISLDSESYLNNCKVWFDEQSFPQTIVAGFPLRDSVMPVVSENHIAYSFPVAGDDSGRVLLGIYSSEPFDSTFVAENHILGAVILQPGESYSYKWGFSWDKTEIPSIEQWATYLNNQNNKYKVTLNR